MAALTLKHALAAPFSLAGESFTFKLSGSVGTTRTATIAATTNVYNVLGASTNDALRILAAAMTAVLPGGEEAVKPPAAPFTPKKRSFSRTSFSFGNSAPASSWRRFATAYRTDVGQPAS